MPWGLVPDLPELGGVLAADEWLVEEELAARDRLVEERAVEDVFELDAWQYLASPPHVEDPTSVEAVLFYDLSSATASSSCLFELPRFNVECGDCAREHAR